MIRLLMIRHGEAAGDVYAYCAPPVEGYLSSTGVEQAAKLGQAMADVHIDRVYCSSMGRAIQTAQSLPRPDGEPLRVMDWLREWAPTETKDDARHEKLRAAAAQLPVEQLWKTPVGEGTLELAQRVILGFQELLAELGLEARHGGFVPTTNAPTTEPGSYTHTVALVAHGGSLGRLLSWLMGVPITPKPPITFELTGLAEVTFEHRLGVFYPRLYLPPPCKGFV